MDTPRHEPEPTNPETRTRIVREERNVRRRAPRTGTTARRRTERPRRHESSTSLIVIGSRRN